MNTDPLDTVLLQFSEQDHWTIRDSLESILITGSPGSGKTSTIGRMLMLAMLMAGFGMLILCCKPDEAARVIEVARMAKREDDVVLFNADSGHCYDPFFYEYNRPGRGQNDGEAVIDFLDAVMSMGKPVTGGSGENRFFQLAAEELSRRTIAMLRLAGERVSITNMYRVISSLPTFPGEYETAEYQTTSYTAFLLSAIRERSEGLSVDEWSDLETCIEFFCKSWPAMDQRVTSSIRATWTGVADRFNFQPYKRIFSEGRSTWLPDQLWHEGKIIISDWPLNSYGISTGITLQGMVKLSCQRAILRRDFSKHPRPVAIWEDEGQQFLCPNAGGVSRENAFLQVARSAGCSTVFLTQSISNVAEALSEHSIGSKTLALIGNFGTRVSFESNDTASNENFARLIGKEWRPIRGTGTSANDINVSTKNELVHIIEPHEFTHLKKPSGVDPIAHAVVWQGGRRFNCTRSPENPEGRTYLVTGFSR